MKLRINFKSNGNNITEAHLEKAIKEMESNSLFLKTQLTGTIWLWRLPDHYELVHKDDNSKFNTIAEIFVEEES
jgi:hypothetical protein